MELAALSIPQWSQKAFFFYLKKVLFYFMCVSVLPTCMYVHHVCTQCLRRPEKVLEPLEV